MNENVFYWLQNWFSAQCDGEWEHEYGIKIETLDNPGWYITIDLFNTSLENTKFDSEKKEITENDWYYIKVADDVFIGAGDITKLEFLLEKFRKFVVDSSNFPKTGANF